MTYTIYKATNKIDNKSYIGFDCNWPYRKTAHKHAVKRGSNLVFHNAIRKHGWNNFDWEIVEQSDNKDFLLNIQEEHYIKKYNTHYIYGNGYNMTYGGEATFGWVPTEETKRKISESNKGKKIWNKGLPSPWTSKRNKANKGKKIPNRQKEYLITDPNGNEYIIKGLVDFCKQNNLFPGNMSSLANGKLNYYKGWKCKHINNKDISINTQKECVL